MSTDLRIQTEEVEPDMKEREKEWMVTHEDLLRMIELMIKEKGENEEEHILEIKEVIGDVKESEAVAIWEVKIKLAKDLDNLEY